jgi:tetratricopeptide (TPR) repeat protein
MTLLAEISSIRRLAQNACYTEGWEFYQQISMPSPTDDRWAGICLWNLGRLEDARTMFTRAKRRGEIGAVIGLASISRLLGSFDDCEAYLESVFDSSLSPDDWVRALRERGDLCLARNQLKAAVESYSEARLEAELCNEAKTLIPMIDQSLGYTYHLLGNDRKAKEVLDRALLSTNPLLRFYVHMTRTFVCIFNSDFVSVESILLDRDFQNLDNPFFNSMYLYAKGIYKIIQNEWDTALTHFQQSIEITEKNSFTETDCLSKIGICKIYIGT